MIYSVLVSKKFIINCILVSSMKKVVCLVLALLFSLSLVVAEDVYSWSESTISWSSTCEGSTYYGPDAFDGGCQGEIPDVEDVVSLSANSLLTYSSVSLAKEITSSGLRIWDDKSTRMTL